MNLNSTPIPGLLEIIKEKNQKNLTVAEIGTHIGSTTISAASLVKSLKGKYIAVDWFQGSPGTYGNHYYDSDGGKTIFEIFNENIKEANLNDVVTTYNMTSLDACDQIPDKSLDICFIDADHIYQSVKKDIQAYLPKIKPGGIICGHDFEPPAINFLNTITEDELKIDFIPKSIDCQNYIIQFFEGKVINQQLIRKNPELFYFHPGVVKAVTEQFPIDSIKHYSDNVWAVKINENGKYEKI